MRPLLLFLFIWTSSTGYGQQNIIFSPQLTFKDVIGDTLRYDFGDPVFDVVITSDTTLYWRSLNPRYGTAAREKITVMPIGAHETMISYRQKDRSAVCWYNDFEKEVATLFVFQGDRLLAFKGTVMHKADFLSVRTITGQITDEDNEVLIGATVVYEQPLRTGSTVTRSASGEPPPASKRTQTDAFHCPCHRASNVLTFTCAKHENREIMLGTSSSASVPMILGRKKRR